MSRTEVKLNYDDYLLFPEDGLRHELIDGEHEVTPAPNRRHQKILRNLSHVVHAYARDTGAGEVYFAPFEVKLSESDVVQPDLVFVAAEHAHRFTDAGLGGPPDLVVEILSPSTSRRDQTLKRKVYEKFGIAEYWLVDPEGEVVSVHRLEGGRYTAGERLSGPTNLRTALLPGLAIPIASLFL
jgi:Uma2 family endonuclease